MKKSRLAIFFALIAVCIFAQLAVSGLFCALADQQKADDEIPFSLGDNYTLDISCTAILTNTNDNATHYILRGGTKISANLILSPFPAAPTPKISFPLHYEPIRRLTPQTIPPCSIHGPPASPLL